MPDMVQSSSILQDMRVKNKRKLFGLYLPLVLSLVVFTFISNVWASPKKHMLVLNSYHKGLSWTDNTVKGIESVIAREGHDIELYFEYMDTKRYFGEEYFQELYQVYKWKYEGKRFDVIMVTDNDALNFMLKHHKQLFPGTPVVFCGINNFQDAMLQNNSYFTGVVEETDMKSTIEIALKLHPQTKRFIVINDMTTTGIALKAQLLEVIPSFKKVDFLFLEDFDINELRQEVKKISPESLIFLLVVNRDKAGEFFTYEESIGIIYGNSNVPIYSIWDFYIARGIVGGMLTSGFQQGVSAAEISVRILKGDDVRSIPVLKKSPNLYMFDFREMKRFNISLKDLPEGSTIVNEPDTFYARFKSFILAVLGIMTVLSFIIMTLAYNIFNRRKTEKLIRESEEKYRDLYDNAPDMYHSVNKDSIIVECNETEAMMLGYAKEEIIGKPITHFLTEKSRIDHEREFPILITKGSATSLEREFVRKDGSTFLASLNVFVEKNSYGDLIKTRTIARDVTRQKQIEEELKRSREELRNLSIHLQSAREEERRRIAREIHDELGHALTTLKLDLSWLKKRLSEGGSNLLSKAQNIIQLVDYTIDAVQKISSELRPGVLDYLNLADAIEWQLKEIQRRGAIECNLSIKSDFDSLSLEQERSIAIFRVFQEAVTNVLRHSGAMRVNVDLQITDNSVILSIYDDGKGISEHQIFDPMSFGILGMRERACYLGGDIKIIGSQKEGTMVELNVPLKESEIKKQ